MEPARATIMLAVMLLLGAGCHTQSGSTVKLDLSSPRSAALAYLRAVKDGDAATARRAAIGNADQLAWIDALASMVRGMRAFDTAYYSRFGGAATQTHIDLRQAIFALAEEPVTLIADGTMDDDGSKARIDPPRRGFTSHFQPSIILLHQNDGWKVSLLQTYAEGLPPSELPGVSAQFAQYKKVGDVLNQTAAEIQARKYKSPQEVESALAERASALRG